MGNQSLGLPDPHKKNHCRVETKIARRETRPVKSKTPYSYIIISVEKADILQKTVNYKKSG